MLIINMPSITSCMNYLVLIYDECNNAVHQMAVGDCLFYLSLNFLVYVQVELALLPRTEVLVMESLIFPLRVSRSGEVWRKLRSQHCACLMLALHQLCSFWPVAWNCIRLCLSCSYFCKSPFLEGYGVFFCSKFNG